MNTNVLFRYFNGFFLALTLIFAAGFLLSNYRVALADPQDGVCANVIDGTTPCPPDTYHTAMYYNGWSCRLSSPWYGGGVFGMGQSGPYYNCCRYESERKVCLVPGGTAPRGEIFYFRSRQVGDSSLYVRFDVPI